MVVAWNRPTKAIIHTQAITENVANELARLPKGKELFAVVKAN
ncbi:MAG: alanine racemase, partial [Enterococcus thailandicus]|nr:alanine racemase [Enterococcus thailandicus]